MRPFTAVTSLFFLFSCAGLLSFMIEKNLTQASAESQDPLFRLLGSAKEAIGDTLFLKADSYFHGGAEENFHDTHKESEQEGPIEQASPAAKVSEDWIARINGLVKSHEHSHLTKDKQKEMLPFFALATSLDPYNVEAILTTAFWLDRHLDKLDDAIQTLEQGRRNNPSNWEIDFQLGNIFLQRKHDYARSEYFYRQSIGKVGTQKIENFNLIDLFYYLGESCLKEGKKDEALAAYQKALGLFKPEDTAAFKKNILDKIKQLSAT